MNKDYQPVEERQFATEAQIKYAKYLDKTLNIIHTHFILNLKQHHVKLSKPSLHPHANYQRENNWTTQ